MGRGDKAAALSVPEQAMAVIQIEKEALSGPTPIEIVAPRGGANGGTRPRHCRSAETTLNTESRSAGSGLAAHSCVAPFRSNVRFAPERSALPKPLRRQTEDAG